MQGARYGMPLPAAMQAVGKHAFNAYDRLAYNAGGGATDLAANAGLSPETSAKVGFGANVATQALPVALGSTIGKAAATLARILEQVRDLKRRNDEKERALVPVAWVSERMGSACSQWTRLRQDGKDSRCLTASGEHGVPVAMARSFYDQTTVDAGAALQGLAAMFNE